MQIQGITISLGSGGGSSSLLEGKKFCPQPPVFVESLFYRLCDSVSFMQNWQVYDTITSI
jgi:hypothetical protein